MALIEPDDPDDIFNMMTADLEFDTPVDVIDLSALSDYELDVRYQDVRESLKKIEEMYADSESTPEGRELHSIRAACIVEKNRRLAEKQS